MLTWNLEQNREHSLYQSTFVPKVFPENLFMRGLAYTKQQEFNYIIDHNAIINLENNMPVQFFDMENEVEAIPFGSLGNVSAVGGMKRICTDNSRYLDMTKPGRIHHFLSFTDLLYWERYQYLKDKHEI